MENLIKKKNNFHLKHIVMALLVSCTYFDLIAQVPYKKIVTDSVTIYRINPRQHPIRLYWKDNYNQPIGTLKKLQDYVRFTGKTLKFAMNAGISDSGIYTSGLTPKGLYIEKGVKLKEINNETHHSDNKPVKNYFLGRKGIFYLTKEHKAYIIPSTGDLPYSSMFFATQSAPLLLMNNTIEPDILPLKKSKVPRNGIGIRADGTLILIISNTEKIGDKYKYPVSFFDFAVLFKTQKCVAALYLDGNISLSYDLSMNVADNHRRFGVILGIEE